MDPLAEVHHGYNPYNYVLNNPMLYMDPLGLDTLGINSSEPILKGDAVRLEDGSIVPNLMAEAKVTGYRPVSAGSNLGGSGGNSDVNQGRGWLNSPVADAPVSSEFKSRRSCVGCSQTHGGTDYSVPIGTRVRATAPGTVARAYYSRTYGNTVIVNHGLSVQGVGNVYTLYAHGNSLQVKQGQSVRLGELVIYSGNTGSRTTGPHLHYEVIVTPSTPFQPGFFGNLDIRYGAGDLGYFLGL